MHEIHLPFLNFEINHWYLKMIEEKIMRIA